MRCKPGSHLYLIRIFIFLISLFHNVLLLDYLFLTRSFQEFVFSATAFNVNKTRENKKAALKENIINL